MAAVPFISQGALLKLRAKELKRLAFLCGQNVSGTKPVVTKRLDRALAVPPPKAQVRSGPVVLSIDLGLRNLAISLMTRASASTSVDSDSTKSKGKKKKKTSNASPSDQSPVVVTGPPSITLHHWERLALVAGAKTGVPASELDSDVDAGPDEIFAPAEIAKLANGFLQKMVLQMNPLPTHILIERQRWRSGSARGIFEWTVRVNTLEAMLHASLRALRDVGVFQGEVISIRPGAVGKFFVGADEEEEKKTATKVSYDASKKLKIRALGRWLGDGENVVITPGTESASDMIDAYKDRVLVTRRRRATSKGMDLDENEKTKVVLDTKLDDLTDSLMQGMAWLRWQENIAILRQENGAEKLLQAAAQAIDESKMADV